MSKTKGTTDMADVKFNDFLLQYFMQWRFNKMPPEVRAQFDVYVRNNDFNGHMGQWRTHLMDAQGNNKPEPDPNNQEYHLTDAEWEKMFKEFQNAFRQMNENRARFANSVDYDQTNDNALDFLDQYYGPGRLFESKVTITTGAEQQLQGLAQLLDQHENTLKLQLNEWGITDQDIKYKDLKEGISSQKYLTDDKFRDKVKRLAETITAYTTDPYYIGRNPGLEQALGRQDFSAVSNGFTEGDIEQWQLNEFKITCTSMLARLANEEKLREVFPSNAIQNAFKGAKERVAYDDKNSKDYIPPKRDDELNFMQTISEWVSDTYEDTMAKYLRFTGDRLYFSPEAKQIVSALHSEKLKPTDGLGAVLKKAGDIKKRLQYKSPRATGYFDWFAKTMTELQQTMPKAFEGALSNGRKMRAIVSEMIMIAVRDGKVKEAKAAMEVLSVIKYGYTTSKIMDALKKEDLTLFSDGKLSWNKTKGMQFITKAMDRSIKTAFMGIGYGVTMVGNALWLSGSKFNGQRGNRIGTAQQAWETQNANELAQRTASNNTLDQSDRARIGQEQQNRNNVNAGQTGNAVITDANYDQHRQNLTNARTAEQAERTRLDALHTANQTVIDTVNAYNQANTRYQQLYQEYMQTIQNLQAINRQITQISNNQHITPEERQARINPLVQQKIELDNNYESIGQQLQQEQNIINQISTDPNLATYQATVQNIEQQEQAYQNQVNANNALDNRLAQWQSATNTINELNSRITARDNEIRNWDQNHQDEYRQLMAYWDMLETGRDTHTGEMYNWFGRFSGKRAQQDFDARKQNYINNYVNNYSYAS
jgi:hypothetical protein